MKRICLTGCNNIVGHGLESLRESVVLEHICIPLPLERMSTAVVIPILDSIIETEGNNLREIDISNIVNDNVLDRPFRIFLAKFNSIDKKCSHCEEHLANDDEEIIQPASMVCFLCFEGSCDDCNSFYRGIHSCSHCELTFCEDCGKQCYACDAFHSDDCINNEEVGSAQKCDGCNYSFCTDCCIKACTNSAQAWRNGRAGYCKKCLGCHFPVLARQNKMLRRKSSRNDELMEENKELTEENKQLRMEIEELRKNMSSGLGILA